MSNLICLEGQGYQPGDGWFEEEIKQLEKYYTEISPKVHRDGWYYNRFENISWIELGGRAFLDPGPDAFLYELEFLDVGCPFLTCKQYAALKLLRQDGMLSKEQRRWVYIHECRQQLRADRLGIGKRLLPLIGREKTKKVLGAGI